MPNVVNILRGYLPVRLFAGHAPFVRRDVNHVVRAKTLQPVGLNEFLALDIPPRAMLLSPILPERSLSMLYAPRGVGKSWLGLSIGLAVASGGSLLRWAAPKPRRVLYVDGEMSLADLQSRLTSIQAGMGAEIRNDGFRILAADNTEAGINLGCDAGQRDLEQHVEGTDLVILDNLSTLLASGSEAASDAWLPIQNWLLRLRRKGISVLFVHHAGVSGKQRGTSRREDALDTVIALRRPDDYSPDEGARFEVHVEKARTLLGEGALPFEAPSLVFKAQDEGCPGRSGPRRQSGQYRPTSRHVTQPGNPTVETVPEKPLFTSATAQQQEVRLMTAIVPTQKDLLTIPSAKVGCQVQSGLLIRILGRDTGGLPPRPSRYLCLHGSSAELGHTPDCSICMQPERP